MEAKHTPGPWRVGNGGGRSTDIKAMANVIVCRAENFRDVDKPAEAEANARLIAAAPDLLTALEETLVELEIARDGEVWPTGASAVARRARAAIAKARGE